MKNRDSVSSSGYRSSTDQNPYGAVPQTQPHVPGFYAKFVKRPFDFVFALLTLPFVLPVFAILFFVIRSDGGPFLFRHPRIGRNGQVFGCLKLRTMAVDSEMQLQNLLEEDADARAEWETHFKLRNDPRITRIGQLLRKTSLDEVPQLFNILSGDMSVVGPRPITQTELELYDELASEYKKVRPGLTGPWQISGRRDNDFASRATQDADYVSNIGFWKDMYILIATIPEVIFGRGR